jgi:sortase B
MNSVSRRDPSTILYAHRMRDNSMFHAIGFFSDRDFFDNNRYVIFNTVYESNVWEIFAFLETHISFNYTNLTFGSERGFLRLAEEISEQARHHTGIEIGPGDRILIMSTCTPHPDPDMRHVLVSRLVKNKDDAPPHILSQMHDAVSDYLN